MNATRIFVPFLAIQIVFATVPAQAGAKRSADYCFSRSGVNLVDTSKPVTATFLKEMNKVGVDTIVRYYDYENETLPGKRLRLAEIPIIKNANLDLMVIFQHNNDKRETFLDWEKRGPADALESLKLAEKIRQPKDSAIYFGVDKDLVGNDPRLNFITEEVISYFKEINRIFKDNKAPYAVGVYGSGATCETIIRAGYAQYCWLSHSHGFTGTKEALSSGQYHIEQFLDGECGGREVDFSKRKKGISNTGQFKPQ